MKMLIAAGLLGTVLVEDKPVDIPRAELPKKSVCAVCEPNGEGEEKVAAGVRYKGKSFFFCNAKEVAEFRKDPEAFLPPVLPRPSPAFTWKSLSGEAVKPSDLKGKPALIDFWATWCVPCVKAMPDVQKIHEKFASKGLQVFGVSVDEDGEKKVRPFLEKRKFTYRFLVDDTKSWKEFGVRAIPALFLLDKEGRVVRQWTGKVDFKQVEAAIASLLEGSR
jgi:peroxiredoxin/YHS domain-containing protein